MIKIHEHGIECLPLLQKSRNPVSQRLLALPDVGDAVLQIDCRVIGDLCERSLLTIGQMLGKPIHHSLRIVCHKMLHRLIGLMLRKRKRIDFLMQALKASRRCVHCFGLDGELVALPNGSGDQAKRGKRDDQPGEPLPDGKLQKRSDCREQVEFGQI